MLEIKGQKKIYHDSINLKRKQELLYYYSDKQTSEEKKEQTLKEDIT